MTDEQVKLCRFLEIMIEQPGAELEKTGVHPAMWDYRILAGNGKPGKNLKVFLEHC